MVARVWRYEVTVWVVIFVVLALSAKTNSAPLYSINARAGVLFDCETAQFLVQQNADEIIEPASFTKLMTLYLAQEALEKGMVNLDDTVVVSAKAWKTGGSRMFIEVNTRVAVSELLKGIAVVSGNDACVALAELIAGKEEVFVTKMNQAVRRLGLDHTVFRDAHGLAPDQRTTARDMAILAYRYIKTYPQVLDFHSMTEYTYNNITQPNRNRLLKLDEGVDGLKTGHLESAGYHLLATAERDGRRLIAVVMGSESWADRENEALKLLNFGFRNFELKQACTEGQVVSTIPVKQGKQKTVDALATRSVTVTAFKHDNDAVKLIKDIPAFLQAPIRKGQTVGTVRVEVDGEELHQVKVVAREDVKKSLLAYWRIGLGILGAVLLIALILRLSKRKKKPAISG